MSGPACCQRCTGTDHLVSGDGPLVCRPCVDLLGSIAADPSRADEHILTAVLELHGDVVHLARVPAIARGQTAGLAWVWPESWPGVEPVRWHT